MSHASGAAFQRSRVLSTGDGKIWEIGYGVGSGVAGVSFSSCISGSSSSGSFF